ncbi:hypothetical protein BD410DRAFT_902208 [Rickenella mellea]|uniref:Uncharacterized protein n=1 Tax=Rickenella mellea TaxID=50990 RepID=A0A4Y7PM90_9AGAM|nr:hypothetical protein BD410DRAFT_902208 [Rickenella mellea]
MPLVGRAKADVVTIKKNLKDLEIIVLGKGRSTDIRARAPPISRLPPELLLPIFLYAVHTQFVSGDTPRDRFLCIGVSHVCQHWRHVALGCSDIWSYIDTTWRSLAMEFVRRSREAPLTVFVRLIHLPSIMEVAAINVVLAEDQVGRIRELQISADNMNYHIFHFNKCMSAARLQALSMNNSSRISLMPNNFFLSHPGTLKSLVLSNLDPPRDPQMLRSLTRLKVSTDWRIHTAFLRVSDIVTMLQLCPDLEEFEFSENGAFLDSGISPHVTAPLLALQHVRLTMTSKAYVALLSHLTTSPAVTVYIDASQCGGPPEPVPTVFLNVYDALTVKITENGYFVITAFSINDAENQTTATVHCRYDPGPNLTIDFRLLEALFKPVLQHAHSLSIHFHIDETYNIPRSNWTNLLLALPILGCLTIKSESAIRLKLPPDIIVSLARALETLDAYRPLNRRPTLHTLAFDGIPFTGKAGKAALSHMTTFVGSCELSNAKIARIDLTNCSGITSQSVQPLECFVDEVIWN